MNKGTTATTNQESKEDSSRASKVSFADSLHVHVHRQTASLNPSVIQGPPIELDWKVDASLLLSLAQEEAAAQLRYEQTPRSTFEKQNVYPRPVARLSAQQRTEILQRNQFSLRQIQDFANQAEQSRNERNETIQNIKTRKERREELEEEKREAQKYKQSAACCGATAAPPLVLDPAEQYLERLMQGGTETPMPEQTSESPFLGGKTACKNCSQRAQVLDEACVHMFQCDGKKCGKTAAGSIECPIHKFIERHAPSKKDSMSLPQESDTGQGSVTTDQESKTETW